MFIDMMYGLGLAAGSLVGWRGFDILIEAFSLVVKSNKNISLKILGSGKDKIRLQSLITKFKMNSFKSRKK